MVGRASGDGCSSGAAFEEWMRPVEVKGGAVGLFEGALEQEALWVVLPSEALRLETDGLPLEMSSV